METGHRRTTPNSIKRQKGFTNPGAPPQGGRGGRVPPILRVRGIIPPPIFRKIVGQIRLVFGFWYGLPSEENPGFAAAWSPSPPFSSAWRSPCTNHRRGKFGSVCDAMHDPRLATYNSMIYYSEIKTRNQSCHHRAPLV